MIAMEMERLIVVRGLTRQLHVQIWRFVIELTSLVTSPWTSHVDVGHVPEAAPARRTETAIWSLNQIPAWLEIQGIGLAGSIGPTTWILAHLG